MSYPIPTKFIRSVAERSRCSDAGADAVIEIALDWLRDKILEERDRQDDYYERIEAKAISDEE